MREIPLAVWSLGIAVILGIIITCCTDIWPPPKPTQQQEPAPEQAVEFFNGDVVEILGKVSFRGNEHYVVLGNHGNRTLVPVTDIPGLTNERFVYHTGKSYVPLE